MPSPSSLDTTFRKTSQTTDITPVNAETDLTSTVEDNKKYDQAVVELDWKSCEFEFRVHAGEFVLFRKSLEGFELKPNIFASKSIHPSDLITTVPTHKPAYCRVVSLPCDEETSSGLKTSGNYLVYTHQKYNRMFVDVSANFDDYLLTFRKKSLATLKRKIRKAEKTNKTCALMRTFTLASEVEEFVQLAKPISAVSYQEQLLGTVFRTDEKWIEEIKQLARANRFRGYILYIEDTPVAYNFCPVYGKGIMLYDLSGYRPESQQHSPGTVLQYLIIEQAFNDQTIKIYDLCTGEGRHKEQFATGAIECCDAYLFPLRPYAAALIGLHYTFERSTTLLVWLLERLKIKDAIKRFFRKRAIAKADS